MGQDRCVSHTDATRGCCDQGSPSVVFISSSQIMCEVTAGTDWGCFPRDPGKYRTSDSIRLDPTGCHRPITMSPITFDTTGSARSTQSPSVVRPSGGGRSCEAGCAYKHPSCDQLNPFQLVRQDWSTLRSFFVDVTQ